MKYYVDIDKVREKLGDMIDELEKKWGEEKDPNASRAYLEAVIIIYAARRAITKLILDPDTEVKF